jgi:hypothetical protein
MSLTALEKSIWIELKKLTNNPKLRLKDVLEWRTTEIEKVEGETSFYCPDNNVYASVPTSCVKEME